MHSDPIGTYAMAHLLAAHTGVAMFRAAAERHEQSPWGQELRAVTSEVEEDRSHLDDILRTLGREPGSVPQRALRLTMQGAGYVSRTLHGWAGLSDLSELEKLRNGVAAKRVGWEVLLAAATSDSRLSRVQLETLIERADQQSDRLRVVHMQMAQQFFQSQDAPGED